MQVYLVGGAVRDALLGLPVTERDGWWVGSTREELLRLRYREVGRDFPVFLHPDTHEEYALARRERKVARATADSPVEFRTRGDARGGPRPARFDHHAMAQAPDGTLVDLSAANATSTRES